MLINFIVLCYSTIIFNNNTENVSKRTPFSHWDNLDFICNSTTSLHVLCQNSFLFLDLGITSIKWGGWTIKPLRSFATWHSEPQWKQLMHLVLMTAMRWGRCCGWVYRKKDMYLRRISRYCQQYRWSMKPQIESRSGVGTGNLICWFLTN